MEFILILTIAIGFMFMCKYANILLKDEGKLVLSEIDRIDLITSIITSTCLLMLASALMTYLSITE